MIVILIFTAFNVCDFFTKHHEYRKIKSCVKISWFTVYEYFIVPGHESVPKNKFGQHGPWLHKHDTKTDKNASQRFQIQIFLNLIPFFRHHKVKLLFYTFLSYFSYSMFMLVLVHWELRVSRIKACQVVFLAFKFVSKVELTALYPCAFPTACSVMCHHGQPY